MLQCVLIIEIDASFRAALTQVFEGEGIEVVAEADSGGGVARIMERDPGVVLLADEMPPLDGVELLPLARRLTNSPIIVVRRRRRNSSCQGPAARGRHVPSEARELPGAA